jgi:zinc finger protein
MEFSSRGKESWCISTVAAIFASSQHTCLITLNKMTESGDQLFSTLGSQAAATSETDGKVVEEIESLCMNCHEDGVTKLLLTKIPFFREIVIMSFYCPHCGFKNSEVQPAGEIQPRGHKFAFKVENTLDLNRQVIKSDTCVLKIQEVDLEVPSGRGQLTNVEGVLAGIADDLETAQDQRRETMPSVAEKIDVLIEKLRDMRAGTALPFTITADDPAGNSWIEPSPDDKPRQLIRTDYARSEEQNAALGLAADTADDSEAPGVEIRPEYHPQHMVPAMPLGPTTNNVDDEDIVEGQVYTFPDSCPGCAKSAETNMKMVNIPHFKQVVVMSTVCDHCGCKLLTSEPVKPLTRIDRSNEIKTGGAIPPLGRIITVQIDSVEDLNRDILKSESCGLVCPELDLSVEPGTLGGRFTTIEGLLTQIRDDLKKSIFDIDGGGAGAGGDSMGTGEQLRWKAFFDRLDTAIKGEIKFTLKLRDPLQASYVQGLVDEGDDPKITVEEYTRTDEEEEDLGLKDMKTEGYEAV